MTFTPPDSEFVGYLLVAGLSLLGTVARILYNIVILDKFSMIAALAQLAVSTFAAALILMLGIRFQWQFTGTAIACGVAAWSGVTIVAVLESRLLARLSEVKPSKEA